MGESLNSQGHAPGRVSKKKGGKGGWEGIWDRKIELKRPKTFSLRRQKGNHRKEKPQSVRKKKVYVSADKGESQRADGGGGK